MRLEPRSRPNRRRHRLRSESGQALVIFALFLPVLIGFGALVIDVGNLYAQKRFVQNAADAAVLAAAQDLPDTAAAQAQAQSYVTRNGGGTAVVSFPDSTTIHVTVTRHVPTYFAKLFGISTWDIPASATAKRAASGPAALMFAHNSDTSTTNCKKVLQITGTSNRFYGAVVSNSGVNESGVNYGAPDSDPSKDGNGTLYYNQAINTTNCKTIKTGATWVAQTPEPIRDWPVPLPVLTCSNGSTGTTCPSTAFATTVNGVACNHVADSFVVVAPLPAGLYCAKTSIRVNMPGTANNVGYIAPTITWTSSNNRLTGFTSLYAQYGGLLFDAYLGPAFAAALVMSGASNSWTGGVFTPAGNAQVSGGGAASTCAGGGTAAACGFIEGDSVLLTGANGIWRGLGPGIGSTGGVSLTE
jgi:Flp pilus assembly protein TadG